MANLVYTAKGLLPREQLEMREVFADNEKECSHAIEYWYQGELVKRGVHVHLKQGVESTAEVNNG
jgi:hypothetical protein